MKRRTFLATMLAASAAPAIARAESLMRIVTRPQGILLPPMYDYIDMEFRLQARKEVLMMRQLLENLYDPIIINRMLKPS